MATINVSRDLTILYALSAEARIGPKSVMALLSHYESPEAIWEAPVEEILKVGGCPGADPERLVQARGLTDALTEDIELIIAAGTNPISIMDDQYPERLHALSDPPTILYVQGQLPDAGRTSIAVVGTHHADAEGIAEAVLWGKGLADRKVPVISGLARGIDGGAHTGALAHNGHTVAVLGCGFNDIYPPEHQSLASEIARTGALISEYPPRESLTKPHLVLRNRLIVALADAVVVVRLHDNGRGSMEAIRRAFDLARPVFLVAADENEASREAMAEGAIPIGQQPDFDLVLNYL